MRIVIVSDIHGNFYALEALPRDWDELWVLGDLVNYGPQPSEVIEFVRKFATVVIRGNHDHAIGYGEDPRCSPRFRRMAAKTMTYTNSVVSDADKAFLRTLPLNLLLQRESQRFYLCHAVPSDPLFGYCPEDSPQWAGEVALADAHAVVVGHTHVPMMRAFDRTTVLNPGSLGQPKTGTPDPRYAVWTDGVFELKSFPYPYESTIEKLKQMGLPDDVRLDLEQVLRTGVIPE